MIRDPNKIAQLKEKLKSDLNTIERYEAALKIVTETESKGLLAGFDSVVTTPVETTETTTTEPVRQRRVYMSSYTKEQINKVLDLKRENDIIRVAEIVRRVPGMTHRNVTKILHDNGFSTSKSAFTQEQKLEMLDDRNVRKMNDEQIAAKWRQHYRNRTAGAHSFCAADVKRILGLLENQTQPTA